MTDADKTNPGIEHIAKTERRVAKKIWAQEHMEAMVKEGWLMSVMDGNTYLKVKQ